MICLLTRLMICLLTRLLTSPLAIIRFTAVGAVMLSRTRPGDPRSRLVSCMASAGGLITSGGGFGNLTEGGGATPAWQLSAVRRYIQENANRSTWPMQPDVNPGFDYLTACPNTTEADLRTCTYGRGYPDLSLMGAEVSRWVLDAFFLLCPLTIALVQFWSP